MIVLRREYASEVRGHRMSMSNPDTLARILCSLMSIRHVIRTVQSGFRRGHSGSVCIYDAAVQRPAPGSPNLFAVQ
jgi:hypothetical protein